METVFEKAGARDYDEAVDFANYVFSHAHGPADFPSMLPKLFGPERFMGGVHYLAREAGKIRAMVGSYPAEIGFGGGRTLPGRGIGTVSVHPYSRSKGYMKTLMKTALDEMKRDGMVFGCLGGQRQRYEYFGFTPVGSVFSFSVSDANISHTIGRNRETGISLEPLEPADGDSLDRIHAMHSAKIAGLFRDRASLFDILASWNSRTFVAREGGKFAGYLVHKEHRSGGGTVSEINLADLGRMAEVLGLFLRSRNLGNATVFAGPHEIEKIARLSDFAEESVRKSAYQFAILDHARFANSFAGLKAGLAEIRDGEFVLHVEDAALRLNSRIRLFAHGGVAGAEATDKEPALKLDGVRAARFLACPHTAMTHPAIRENGFLRDLLPLPVFWESPDGV